MKKYFLFFIGIFIVLTINSQPVVKLFAFEQESLPGAIPVGVKDENGNTVKKAAAKKNYFIFLSFKKSYAIQPELVYINGLSFNIQNVDTVKSPVEITNNAIPAKSKKIVLVPRTVNRVLELKISRPFISKPGITVRKLTAKNDVVIVYLWKKKRYYLTSKQIKILEPALNE